MIEIKLFIILAFNIIIHNTVPGWLFAASEKEVVESSCVQCENRITFDKYGLDMNCFGLKFLRTWPEQTDLVNHLYPLVKDFAKELMLSVTIWEES